MEKLKVLNRITESGVVAVVRADSKEEAILIAEACVKGGLSIIEITFTIRDAEAVIRN